MFHKTATLSIFALLLAVASCRPQVDLYDCSNKEDGPHADPLDNNAFYVCFDGELTVRSKCDAEETFDANLRTCTGSEDEDLTMQSGVGEFDSSIEDLKSKVSGLLENSIDSMRYPNRPPTRPPQKPTPPDQPPSSQPESQNKIFNIQVSENIFPRSIIVVGRANREQKNK